jgi:serine/threonine-protein kinase
VSPDGSRVALVLRGPPSQLAIYDLGRGSLTGVATEIFPMRPVWTPGSERVVYASARETRSANLWTRRADAAGEEERLSTSDEIQVPVAVSPDGRWLVYEEGWTADRGGYRKVPLDGSGPPQPLFPGRVWGAGASFSPDGRWLAYASIESGRAEVYVRPFPTGEERFQLSTGGGNWPVWAGGGEVFYESGGMVYGVAVAPRGDSLTVGKPVPLFQIGSDTRLAPYFDAMPDGQSFLALRSSGRQHVSLILGWPSELARRSR